MRSISFVALTALGLSSTAQANDFASCTSVAEDVARLACFDQKAKQFADPLVLQAPPVSVQPMDATAAAEPEPEPPVVSAAQRAEAQPSEITRFWDLEHATSRDTFELRAYRPVALSLTGGTPVNRLPSSPTADHTAANPTAYQPGEVKLNLSVRTKLVSGMLRRGDDPLRDSLWFGYTQQSHWQLFNKGLSRPFRNTDHEPELTYVFPHFLSLPSGWTYRMTGVGLVHQSNGQTLPLSRSWNRIYLMAAGDKIADNGDRFTLQARVWTRLNETNGKDDNPDISDYVGRGELEGRWSFDTGVSTDSVLHTLGLSLRHSLRSQGRGSARLEYLRSVGKADSGLRFHTQLFYGYGDSLLDYNVKRTTLTAGLSLVDW
ncbi:phospholipase A [Hydrogenophaga sp. PAMC20947]|uniref:phospholipase A n=1 Tax=Hydrogenophaga sp. PAMC20947 TaxID=2565558 RepID=UPI00109D822B|nr:phospholipase A [Hydrogenophaga sp. PAMC20947]QCB46601.1 phospholipase [Hydrogenophaga sp. PAMC20947]